MTANLLVVFGWPCDAPAPVVAAVAADDTADAEFVVLREGACHGGSYGHGRAWVGYHLPAAEARRLRPGGPPPARLREWLQRHLSDPSLEPR